MITQDSIRFYKHHGVYKQFGGVVLASEEGERIADALGDFEEIPNNRGMWLTTLGRHR